mgnify:CR=1 FL=1
MNYLSTTNNEKIPGGVTGKGFIKGDPRINYEGRPPETEEQKIIKKATKQLIEEYKEALGESLELIRPALIEKAVKGDIQAIKEINDRVMGKANQNLDVTTAGESLNTALVRFIDGK